MFSERFDFIVNLAAETRYGQSSAVYEERCTRLSQMCAQRAADIGVGRYIEMSTAQVLHIHWTQLMKRTFNVAVLFLHQGV